MENAKITLDNGIIVERYNIITTNLWIHAAYEPAKSLLGEGFSHSTITTFDGKWYGRIGTGPLPQEIDSLPAGSDTRIDAVRSWYRNEESRAYAAILSVFPDAIVGKARNGEIVLHV